VGNRIVHVGEGGYLQLHLKSLRITKQGEQIALIPFEDIAIVILDGPEITITAPLIAEFANNNVSLVVCNEKHLPNALLQPLEANSIHTEVLRLQIKCSVPKQKRIWQQIITAKVDCQAQLLSVVGRKDTKLENLVNKIMSGDATNIEGQAAARYWKLLLGEDFIRDFNSPGANSMLNYGYAVLRATVTRALCGTGLHPAIGIHHHNRYNPYALADDAIEPLRPLVDCLVINYLQNNPEPDELDAKIKKYLLQLLVLPVIYAGKEYTILGACDRYAASLKRGICEEARKIEIPLPKWSAVFDVCG
jgi:CRISP-associated protein Cas1